MPGNKFIAGARPGGGRNTVLLIIALVAIAASQVSLRAEPGIKDKEILIGSCSALKGPAGELGTAQLEGAKAYLDYVNAEGGVHGRKIKLLALDDGYEPGKAIVCFKRLLKEGVFAGAFFVGTPTAAKHAFLAEENKLPIIGLFTGAQLLREPFKRYIVNVRASYYDETREQIDHLWKDLGMRKIGVVYQDDAFGIAVLEGVRRALKRYGAAPAAIGSFPRNSAELKKGVAAVRAAKPEAVILVGPYKPVAEIVKASKASAWEPLFVTVSFVGTESFIRAAGRASEGTLITQVVPPSSRTDFPGVALYLKLLQRYSPKAEPGFVSLEGFVDAVILVEGLKHAGRELTREKFLDTIEAMNGLDLGFGPRLKTAFGPKEHQAFNGVYSTVVRDGKAVLFEDWKELRGSK